MSHQKPLLALQVLGQLLVVACACLVLGYSTSADARPQSRRSTQATARQRQTAVHGYRLATARFHRDRDVDAALIQLAEVIRLDPTYAEPHRALAVLLESRHKWVEAADAYGRYLALSSMPGDAAIVSGRVRALRVLADGGADLASRKKAERELLIAQGRDLAASGRVQESLRCVNQAVEIGGADWETELIAAAALFRTGDTSRLKTWLAASAVGVPDSERARFAAAREASERALRCEALLASASSFLETGDVAAASRDLVQIARSEPERYDIGLLAAATLALAKDYARADALLERLASCENPIVAARARSMRSQLPKSAVAPAAREK